MSRLYNYRSPLPKADGPCKDCCSRQIGCHGSCVKYNSWKAERQQELDKWQAEKKVNDAIIGLNYNTHRSITKQMNKRK